MKENKARGRANAPYLFVMSHPATSGMEAWFLKKLLRAGIKKTDARFVYLVDGRPLGAGGKALVSQIKAAKVRFEREVRQSTPDVVIPMGTEAFRTLTGINEAVEDAQGYIIRAPMFKDAPYDVWEQVGTYKAASRSTGAKKGDPKYKWVTRVRRGLLGDDFAGVVVPSYTLDFIRKGGFEGTYAFETTMNRAARALIGELRMVETGKITTEVEDMPTVETLGDVIAVDIETHGVNNEVIDLVSLSDGDTTAVLEWTEAARVYVESVFALRGRTYALHNSQFDLPRLALNGVWIPEGVIDHSVFDTMYAFVTLQPNLPKGLGRVVPIFLDAEPWKTGSKGEKSHWRAMVNADPKTYAAKDALHTYWLAAIMIPTMKDDGCWDLFMGTGGYPGPGLMETLPELTHLTEGGVSLLPDEVDRLNLRLERRMLAYLNLWRLHFPNTSYSSRKMLEKLLYNQWGLPVQRNDYTHAVSVDELALVILRAHVEFISDENEPWREDPRCNVRTFDLLLKMRETDKLWGTYVFPASKYPTPRVHPQYMPAAKDYEGNAKGSTDTGRLAAAKPNIQNQPKAVRKMYGPDAADHCLISADYKSAELFILAGASGDKRLMSDLLSGDIHTTNSERYKIPRPTTKNVTYATQYLASPDKASRMILKQAHVFISSAECADIADKVWGFYTRASAYKDLLVDQCIKQGYITNHFGHTRYFYAQQGPTAVNFIPQSDVARILLCVLKPLAVYLRSIGGRLVTTVHDQFLASVPADRVDEAARGMKQIMERKFDNIAKDFYVPVEVEVGAPGASWANLKKYEIVEVA